MDIYKAIYKKIKKSNTIVIARHVGADPDALASQIALRDIIINTFPKKKVYAVGTPASKFKFLGILDRFNEEMYQDSLLIIVDTPDKKRIDGVDYTKFKNSIKIDHHPFIEKICELEFIDETASSASQLIVELTFNSKLLMTKEAAEKLYMGIVSDTNRFLYYYTTSRTFELVSKLIKKTNIDFTSLYEILYLRPYKEFKFQSYITNNLIITPEGLAYIKITEAILKEHEVDSATAGNLITNFNYIEEILVWVMFTEDVANNTIRTSIRSRGPVINEVASHFGGGGHIYASGARLKNFEEVDKIVEELNLTCKAYTERSKEA